MIAIRRELKGFSVLPSRETSESDGGRLRLVPARVSSQPSRGTRTDDALKICDFFCHCAYTLIEPSIPCSAIQISLFGPKQFPVRRHREFCDKATYLLRNSRHPPRTAIFAKIPCYFP
jgi:hypothetical protein